MASSLRFDMSVMDDPARSAAAISVAAACAQLFMSHGAVAWTDELETVPVAVAAVMSGMSYPDDADIQGIFPTTAPLRVRDAARVVTSICQGCDEQLLRSLVAAAEAGTVQELADNAPGWAFSLRTDPELAIAAGIAYDAVHAVGDVVHQPMTMAAASILAIAPDFDFEQQNEPAPAFGM